MSQLLTLLWLKWKLFRSTLRTTKGVVNQVASFLTMLAALALALIIAIGLGLAAYALTSSNIDLQSMRTQSGRATLPSAEFIFFGILSMIYFLWATLPLSIGASRQFDPRNLLHYPLSFRKLFALDFVSEIATLQSVFAIPVILALGLGAGLSQGRPLRGISLGILAAAFGLALTKCISASVGSLLRKRRTRGETLLALFGAAAGLGGALFAQVAPVVFRNVQTPGWLRWTPPGIVAFGLTTGTRQTPPMVFFLTFVLCAFYTVALIFIAYWLTRRSILGGGKVAKSVQPKQQAAALPYTGWTLPLLSPVLSGAVEKEVRYIMRNAQIRMMALMPLLLIIVRFVNRTRLSESGAAESAALNEFWKYGHALLSTGTILYVFLVLTGLSCNLFAFEHAGMRTLVLAPVKRKFILAGKNIANALIALVLSLFMLLISELVFRDITAGALLFAGLTFLVYAALTSLIGNWLSIYFPKRMKMGSRMNVSGVVGLLVIPIIFLMTLPPLAAVAAGYIAQSLLVEYATLALLAALTIALYLVSLEAQAESFEKRELRILEAVTEPDTQ